MGAKYKAFKAAELQTLENQINDFMATVGYSDLRFIVQDAIDGEWVAMIGFYPDEETTLIF